MPSCSGRQFYLFALLCIIVLLSYYYRHSILITRVFWPRAWGLLAFFPFGMEHHALMWAGGVVLAKLQVSVVSCGATAFSSKEVAASPFPFEILSLSGALVSPFAVSASASASGITTSRFTSGVQYILGSFCCFPSLPFFLSNLRLYPLFRKRVCALQIERIWLKYAVVHGSARSKSPGTMVRVIPPVLNISNTLSRTQSIEACAHKSCRGEQFSPV
mmetsp:Transcript_6574/g.11360  ORF Transcript_6574/g.11360 Transcript_6574/m.11360 type:complete len:217 (-) Transcript_6574:11-661(-)